VKKKVLLLAAVSQLSFTEVAIAQNALVEGAFSNDEAIVVTARRRLAG
jgi:hypothetical protein